MRKKLKIPRILKIDKIEDFKIFCIFNNGQRRIIDFDKIFKDWEIKQSDIEYPLLNKDIFKQVKLRNYTLSWDIIKVKLLDNTKNEIEYPYELSPDLLYKYSEADKENWKQEIGLLIKTTRKKAGLTQKDLANRSGTTRFYISRIENDRTDVELSTIRKIIEIGLGRSLKFVIE